MVKERKGFMKWYTSPKGQKVVGCVYSVGAAVVIVGALFKILHLPFASELLMVGMLTEALLFTIGVFDDPHPVYHWDHVFPQLMQKEADPLVNHLGGGVAAGGAAVGGAVSGGAVISGVPSVGNISDSDAKKLTESIKQMSETAGQLANISKVAGLTDSYAANLSKASEAAAQFAIKQQNLDSASNSLLASYQNIAENMTTAQANTKSFAEKAAELSKNLGSINTSYELQIKGIQSQVEAIENQSKKINAVSSDFDKMQAAALDSARNMEAYKQMTEQLSKNIADLNSVYGNMLNALK